MQQAMWSAVLACGVLLPIAGAALVVVLCR
jgi:hypothetical protein